MAIQTVTIPCTDFAILDSNAPNRNYHGQPYYDIAKINQDLRLRPAFGFAEIPDTVQRRLLSQIEFRAYFDVSNLDPESLYDEADISFSCYPFQSSFDENTVTYGAKPESGAANSYFPWAHFREPSPSQFSHSWYAGGGSDTESAALVSKILRMPYFYLYQSEEDFTLRIYGREAAQSLRPVLIVSYDDSVPIVASQVTAANAPTGGYLNPRNTTTFAWGYSLTQLGYIVATTVTQASATFCWREGSSGDFTAIPISGDALSVTILANTFPTGSSIQWYVEGTDTFGSTSQTPVYTVSTAAAMVYSTPVTPVQTVEDGSAPITFEWTTQSDDGYPATGYSLLYKKPSDASWTQLARSETEAGGSYTAPADTFLAGEYLWGVNVKNIDGVWSSGNPSARFVVVAAPPAPIVTASAVPFAAVNWQVEGQQAYRITVDDSVYGPYFGTVKSWTVPDYLEDGEHTISVEVQGVYGLWSQPGRATFTVANQPGTPIELQGSFDRDAALSWIAGDATADFLIYRDDVQIGHTSGQSFTDRLVLGAHDYRVVNRLPDGNYSVSNVVTGTMRSCTAAIAPLSGGDWIELKLSENSNREESFTWAQTVSLRHFAGAAYPVAELSPYADESGAYDVAFADLPSAQAFEALRGQAVILKSRGGNAMVGILATLAKRMTEFYIAYVWTLQRMHWRDYIDADG